MPQLRIELFGGCEVTMDGEWVGAQLSPHAQALLAYLALNRESAFERTSLIAILFPNENENTSESHLQAILSEIQHLLNQRIYDTPPFLLANHVTATLNPASSIIVDTITFENHRYAVAQHQHRRVEACPQCIQQLVMASELYTGAFLEGVEIQSQPFMDWMVQYRDKFRVQVLDTLDILLSHYQLVADDERILYLARKQIAIDSWAEKGHICLLKSLIAQGEPGAASAHFESLRQQYLAAFNIGLPQTLIDAFTKVQVPQEWAGAPLPEPSTPLPESTPIYAFPKINMPIIGREADLLQLSDCLLENTDRCIMLTGPGGVGKTVLALAVAEATRGAFKHGVVYVVAPDIESSDEELSQRSNSESQADVSENNLRYTAYGEMLIHSLRDALHLAFDPTLPDERQLFDQLADREMLLILDDAERCPEKITDLIQSILSAAPHITLLLCSRRHIEIPGMRVLEVAPLPVPQQTHSALAADYPSVRLFVASAQQQQANFRLSADALPAVIDICQQVEGLPLSIVLAASWIPKFNVDQIADAVNRDLSVLVATSPEVPERHRSLQAVFEGSWRLLSASEQNLLEQAAVFKSGFDQEAALAILDISDDTEHTLRMLVRNGFLLALDQGRFDLPRIVRQYILNKYVLNESVLADGKIEDEAISFRHAAYYLDVEKWQKEPLGFENDIHNIRHAWQWAAVNGQLSTFASGLMGWIQFLDRRGRFQEGNTASELLIWRLKYREDLDQASPEVLEMVGRLYVARGGFLTMLGKYTEASEIIQYSLNLALSTHNTSLEAAVQIAWGMLLWRQGDYAAAQTRISQALQQAQTLNDAGITLQGLYHLGIITMHQSDYSVAQMYLQQSLELSESVQDGYQNAKVLNALGFLAQSQGDYAIARNYLQEGLQRFEKVGSLWGKGTTQQNLGYVAHRLGEYDEARTWYEQALFTNRECVNRYAEVKTLSSLGLLFYHQGDFESTHIACRQAYDMARQLGDRASEAEVLMVWGHAYAAQNAITEAAAAYQKALDLRQELGQRDESTEAVSGLVRLALMEGAGIHTMPFVERILDRMRHAESLKGASEPLRIYLTCYYALADNHDPRAIQVLDRAYHLLLAQADKLDNLAQRKSLLSNVAVHREIVNLYESRNR